MRTFDCNCFSGNWPFHHVRTNTPGLMLEKHRKAGIDGGLMSSLEAIFYEDSWEADSRLSEKLSGTPYLHAQTINPLHPGWESMLLSGVKSGIRAVKIFPGFHGYQLNDPHLQTLCDALIQYNLPLVINLRMEDNRITYMFHPQAVTTPYIEYFLYTYTGITTLLSNIALDEIMYLSSNIKFRGNVFADISGLRTGQFNIQRIDSADLSDYLVYGSCAPIFALMSTKCIIDMDPVDDNIKKRILDGHSFVDRLMDI